MIDIYHITPINDFKPHIDRTKKQRPSNGNGNKIKSLCRCKPTIEYYDDRILVIHSSWDGREALEEANEILK